MDQEELEYRRLSLIRKHSDCCIIHGCRFKDINCPVYTGENNKGKICGRCIDELFKEQSNLGIEWQDQLMENQTNKINSIFLIKNRKFKLNKINNMKRFFGMMPSSEIEQEKRYIDDSGLKITIQAGKNGWTILYADSSSEYADVVDTTENNHNKALEVLKSHLSVKEL